MVQTSRRGLLGFIGAAGASLGMKKAPISPMSGKFMLGELSATEKTFENTTSPSPITVPNVNSALKASSYFKAFGMPKAAMRNIYREAKSKCHILDPDILAMRSFSLVTRQQMQYERLLKRLIDQKLENINVGLSATEVTDWEVMSYFF